VNSFILKEIVTAAEPADERLWVPQGDRIWFRPLLLDTATGTVANLLRVRRGGNLGRHLHNAPVFGYVLRGSWRYLEHDWVARAGNFVYEPPGEVHTLVVDDAAEHDEMVTYFVVHGGLVNIDEQGRPLKVENAFTKIELCDRHFRAVGLGPDYVKQFIR
jgi:quercetin dioxygenase-like cupin family protein